MRGAAHHELARPRATVAFDGSPPSNERARRVTVVGGTQHERDGRLGTAESPACPSRVCRALLGSGDPNGRPTCDAARRQPRFAGSASPARSLMASSVNWRARSNSPRATASATCLANTSSAAAVASPTGNFPRPICAPFPVPGGVDGAPCAPGGGSCASVIPSPCDSVRSVQTDASAGGIVRVQVVAGSVHPSRRSDLPVGFHRLSRVEYLTVIRYTGNRPFAWRPALPGSSAAVAEPPTDPGVERRHWPPGG